MKVRVSIFYEVSGYVEVEAKSEVDAQDEVADKLDESGIDTFDFTPTSRDFYVLHSEIVHQQQGDTNA